MNNLESTEELRNYYNKNNIKSPKTLLPREVWLFSEFQQVKKESYFLSDGIIEGQENWAIESKKKDSEIAQLKKTLSLMNLKALTACTFTFGVGLGFFTMLAAFFVNLHIEKSTFFPVTQTQSFQR